MSLDRAVLHWDIATRCKIRVLVASKHKSSGPMIVRQGRLSVGKVWAWVLDRHKSLGSAVVHRGTATVCRLEVLEGRRMS